MRKTALALGAVLMTLAVLGQSHTGPARAADGGGGGCLSTSTIEVLVKDGYLSESVLATLKAALKEDGCPVDASEGSDKWDSTEDGDTVKGPPDIGPPGAGNLHVVTQYLTKDVSVDVTTTGDATVWHFKTITVTVPEDASQAVEYKTTVAFKIASTAGAPPIDLCTATDPGDPALLRAPGWMGGGPFDYPSDGAMLATYAAHGYIDTNHIDVSGAPSANTASRAWHRQPTFADIAMAFPNVSGLALRTHVPGDLYVSLVLTAHEGDARWRVKSWDYAFDVQVNAKTVLHTGGCGEPSEGSPSDTQGGSGSGDQWREDLQCGTLEKPCFTVQLVD